MRYFLLKICMLSFIGLLAFPSSGQAKPAVSANNAILMEQKTGRVLYEKAVNDEVLIASITKNMTAIIALELGDLTDLVSISERAQRTEGSSIYLVHDKEMSLEDLLYGLMLRSGNDASVAIAEHIGGSVEGFVYLMNEKAQMLGMTNTHFENPHGLDGIKHFSSAADMALLMRHAMENDTFAKISNTKMYKSENRAYSWHNKNKLLTKLYPYCTGGKTGFTKKAGRTLVTTASKDGIDLIAVTLDGSSDWNDHINMYEWGFSELEQLTIEEEGDVYFLNDDNELIHGLLHEEVTLPLRINEQRALEKKVIFTLDQASEVIAQLEYWVDSELISSVPVYRPDEAELPSFLTKFFDTFKKMIWVKRDG